MMRRIRALALIVAIAGAAMEARQTALPAEAVAELDQFIEAQRTAAAIPGMSVAINFKGALVYSKGFGQADLENRIPVTKTTALRTASVAKPMTATGVMKLVEAGKLDLDAPIQKYCPAFPTKQWPVTPRLILGHLAGIRHYKSGESSGTTFYFTIEDSLAIFKDDPLLHEPGTKYLYSTFGYSVLGCAIQGASKQTYEAFMRENVWTPAGMARTRLDRLYDIIPDRSRGYYKVTEDDLKSLPPVARTLVKPGDVMNAPLHDTSMKVPGGGLVSTPEDLTRFAAATMEGRLLKKETVEQMWMSGKTKSGEVTGYGFGWDVQPPQEGIRRISHGGNQIGASAGLIVLPEINLAYAVMTNLEDVTLPPITRGIAQILRKYLMK